MDFLSDQIIPAIIVLIGNHFGGSHGLDLSRIYAAPITRLGCLAFEGQGAFASQS